VKQRLVIPEILDSLATDDPRARRARHDLALINAIMGNYRWLSGKMRAADKATPRHWIEIGSGDGPLAGAFGGSSEKVTGLDLAPRPPDWPTAWKWARGDLFETLPDLLQEAGESGLVANLFLHHFDDELLARLGVILNNRVSRLLFVEPARETLFRVLGYGLFPFVNAVTRHDLQVSIGAGFRRGELAAMLGLDRSWQTCETVTPLGAYRFEAWKA
jgi:hypothetical protein